MIAHRENMEKGDETNGKSDGRSEDNDRDRDNVSWYRNSSLPGWTADTAMARASVNPVNNQQDFRVTE